MVLAGIQKLTLLDYPGLLAATLFTPGCNFRCPFCHNASLVSSDGSAILSDGSNCETLLNLDETLDFLRGRFGRLQGVAVTGGEPTMQADLDDFLRELKKIGYKVKLDSNGTYPEKLAKLINDGLVDYVAMDIKNCWEKYDSTAGLKLALPEIIKNCQKSFEMLKASGVEHEFRTTIVKQLHELEDIEKMAQMIGPEEKYFLQNFVDSGDIIGTDYSAHDKATLLLFLETARKYCPKAELRGVD